MFDAKAFGGEMQSFEDVAFKTGNWTCTPLLEPCFQILIQVVPYSLYQKIHYQTVVAVPKA